MNRKKGTEEVRNQGTASRLHAAKVVGGVSADNPTCLDRSEGAAGYPNDFCERGTEETSDHDMRSLALVFVS